MNPNLSINKAFKEKVKICMKTTFGTMPQQHISKILPKPDTRVLALVMFYETRQKNSNTIQMESIKYYGHKISVRD